MRRLALALAVLAIVPAAAAQAAKVPTAICLTWTNDLDVNDTVTMDFMVRPAGSLETQDVGDGDAKYKFYSLHGISGLGEIPGGTFANIAGTASTHNTFSNFTGLNVGIVYNEPGHVYVPRALRSRERGAGGDMLRVPPTGVVTQGSYVTIDCAGETIND